MKKLIMHDEIMERGEYDGIDYSHVLNEITLAIMANPFVFLGWCDSVSAIVAKIDEVKDKTIFCTGTALLDEIDDIKNFRPRLDTTCEMEDGEIISVKSATMRIVWKNEGDAGYIEEAQ